MTCTVADCGRPAEARGWCHRHYLRWYRHGDPLGGGMDRHGTAEERFWRCVNKTDACWLWTGSISVQGYGIIGLNGVRRRAHRVAYELLVGPIPEGLYLDHLCRVRHCVNPEHLEPVTNAENLRRGYFAIKTHCPHGHPYSGDNLYRRPNGTRVCRTCSRESLKRSNVKRRAKRRAAALEKLR